MNKKIKKGDIWVIDPKPTELPRPHSCIIASPDLYLENNPRKPHGKKCDCIRLHNGWEMIYDKTKSKCYKKLMEESCN